MGFIIRRAAPEDAFTLCDVLRRSIVECCALDHRHDPVVLRAWLGNKTPPTVAGWLAAPDHFSVVAEHAGVIVGLALLTRAGKLSLCYVVPEALHQGAGKALLTAIEAQARAWEIRMLRLHSTASARDFFARNGYINAGKEASCFGLECDFFWKKLDAVPLCAAPPPRFCRCSTE
jgi:GNAT superfamily N-acetyltransferase